MTASNPNIRETLNNGVLQQRADADRDLAVGALMGMLIQGLTPTQTGITPVTTNANFDVATLGGAADRLYQLDATAGAFTGILVLRINADDTVIPQSGQALWDGPGTTRIRLNKGDAITALSSTHALSDGSNTNTSVLERTIGQRD